VARIIQEQPAFARRRFFHGQPIRGTGVKDIAWLGPDGKKMSDEAWGAGFVKCRGVQLAGRTGELDEFGEPSSATRS
jgi:glycogen operon protein